MSELMILQSHGGNLPENMIGELQSRKCPLCQGRKHLFRLVVDPVDKQDDGRVECHRCGGVGKLHETGPQKQTRSRKLSEGIAPEDLNAYAKGLTMRNWYALRWVVLGEQECFPHLHRVAFLHISEVAEREEWSYNENARYPRLKTLVTLALSELQAPAKYSSMETRGAVMHVNPRTFERTWMDRYIRLSVHVNQWYSDASDHINRAHGKVKREERERRESESD